MNPTTAKIGLCFGVLLPAEGVGVKQEQWETVFEGMVATKITSNYKGARAPLTEEVEYGEGTYRLVVDGDVIDTDTQINGQKVIWLGNVWLQLPASDTTSPDPGGDYGFRFYVPGFYNTSFYSRTPGTYSLKIERLVN